MININTQQATTRRYVLTGGPGIGKTTVLELLKQRGYQVLPETARAIIEEQQRTNGTCLPWIDLQGFQDALAQRQIDLEERADCAELFLDRGLIDGHGYAQHGGVQTSDIIIQNGTGRYDMIFILDCLPNYRNDACRKETPEEAKRIHEALFRAYVEFGYNPIKVPAMTPEQRTDFILTKIREKESERR